MPDIEVLNNTHLCQILRNVKASIQGIKYQENLHISILSSTQCAICLVLSIHVNEKPVSYAHHLCHVNEAIIF
jgi:hypothetical protein